jgi:hypothetical protein
VLRGGSALSGTIFADSYRLESGTATSLLAGPGAVWKTTSGAAAAMVIENASSVTVEEGQLTAASITTGTLTIGGAKTGSAAAPVASSPRKGPAAAPAAGSETSVPSANVSASVLLSAAQKSAAAPFIRDFTAGEPAALPSAAGLTAAIALGPQSPVSAVKIPAAPSAPAAASGREDWTVPQVEFVGLAPASRNEESVSLRPAALTTGSLLSGSAAAVVSDPKTLGWGQGALVSQPISEDRMAEPVLRALAVAQQSVVRRAALNYSSASALPTGAVDQLFLQWQDSEPSGSSLSPGESKRKDPQNSLFLDVARSRLLRA